MKKSFSNRVLIAVLAVILVLLLSLGLAACDSTYSVVFKNGDTVISTIKVNSGEKLTAEQIPFSPNKSGYSFDGWFAGEDKVDVGFGINSDTTVEAKFTAHNSGHTVVIRDKDMNVLYTQVGDAGAAVGYDEKLEGYKLEGYYLDKQFDNPATSYHKVIPNSDLELYAKFEPIIYTIRFDAGIGYGNMDDVQAVYGERISLPSNRFVLPNRTFIEWRSSDKNGSVSFVDGARVRNLTTEDGAVVTLTAVFDTVDSEDFRVKNGVLVEYTGNAERICIPATVQVISKDAFKNANAEGIKAVEVTSYCNQIEKGAFAPLKNLEELKLPFIGETRTNNNFLAFLFGADKYNDNSYSFKTRKASYNTLEQYDLNFEKQCIPQSLKTVFITEPLYEIADGAFYMAYGLEKVSFFDADELMIIGDYAFDGCLHLGYDTTLEISNPLNFLYSVQYIGERAFASYVSEEDENDEDSFSYFFSSLMDISPLQNVVSVGSQAFSGALYLNAVKFGNKLETIGDRAFAICISLQDIVLPDSLTEVGDMAFSDCMSLTTLTLGTGLESIGQLGFAACTALMQVTVRGDIPASLGKVAFCNQLEYIYNDEGLLTGYTPIIDENGIRFYINESAKDRYTSDWSEYASRFEFRGETVVLYWGENSDGSFATKFELAGGTIATVTDTDLEFLNLIDLFSDFPSSLSGNKYTLSFEAVDVPDENKRGDEQFFRISNPLITDYANKPMSFLVRVRNQLYSKGGKNYSLPVLEYISGYFIELGNSSKSLYKIDMDELGHYMLFARETADDEFAEYMPEGAVIANYRIYYILSYSEKMVGMDFLDEKGNLIENRKFLVSNDEKVNSRTMSTLLEVKGEDSFELCFTSYPTQIIFDGKGQALLTVTEEDRETRTYVGAYSINDGAVFGDASVVFTMTNLQFNTFTYNGKITVDGFFNGVYHKCTIKLIRNDGNAYNETIYVSADLTKARTVIYEDGDQREEYRFIDYGEYAQYAVLLGEVNEHGTYSLDGNNISIKIDNRPEVKGVVVDKRGSFTVTSGLGFEKEYRVYDEWEDCTFYMDEDFYGTPITYYWVKMDGYGKAIFHDEHDDGIDNYYVGTYYNTYENLGENEYGPYDIYYFEGVESDERGVPLENGKPYSVYYVLDPYIYEYEGEYDYIYEGVIVSVSSSSTEYHEYTVYDENGLKFADMTISPFGVATLTTVYDTKYKNGTFVSTANEYLTNNVTCVSFSYNGTDVVYVAVYDLMGNFLFKIENVNGVWTYICEGEIRVEELEEQIKIYPDVSLLEEIVEQTN